VGVLTLPRLSPIQRLAISIGVTALATFMLIQVATWPLTPSLKILGATSYIALVPSTVLLVTLWEEVRASIARVLVRIPRQKPRKPMYLSTISTSPTLYSLRKRLLRGFVKAYAERLAKLFVIADVALDPYNTAVLTIVTSIAVTPALGFLTYLALRDVAIAILASLTSFGIALAAPYIIAYANFSSRRGGVEMETPFFALYATLVERTGKSLVTAFERIANQFHVFKRLSIEASILRKMLSFFHYSPIDALQEYARLVPSKLMSRLVSGYVSIVKIGGNTASYLESAYRSMLDEITARWSRYVETASMMGEVILALFMLFPTLLALGAIAFSQAMSIEMLQLFTYIIAPMIGAALYVVMDSMQPKMPSHPIFTPIDKIIAFSGLPLAIATVLALNEMGIAIKPEATASIAICVALLPEISLYIARTMEVKYVERDLPSFLRDIAEFLRIGYNVPRAITAIAKTRRYNRFLDSYVSAVSILLQLNIPLQRIQQNFVTRSWLFNYVLFVLSDLEHLGALTPTEIERLSNFIETLVQSKENSRKNLTLYVALAVLTPLFIILLAMMSSSLITMASSKSVVGMIMSLVSPQMIEAVVNQTTQLAIAVAVVMGVTAAKVREGTGLNTCYTLLALSTVSLVLIFWNQVQEMITGTITSIMP